MRHSIPPPRSPRAAPRRSIAALHHSPCPHHASRCGTANSQSQLLRQVDREVSWQSLTITVKRPEFEKGQGRCRRCGLPCNALKPGPSAFLSANPFLANSEFADAGDAARLPVAGRRRGASRHGPRAAGVLGASETARPVESSHDRANAHVHAPGAKRQSAQRSVASSEACRRADSREVGKRKSRARAVRAKTWKGSPHDRDRASDRAVFRQLVRVEVRAASAFWKDTLRGALAQPRMSLMV